jgi:hypothetical protein
MDVEVFSEKRKNLISMKNQIDSRVVEWERIKHDINPLELVFTFMKGESVSKINPVSRAFFKMIEILKIVQDDIPIKPIKTLHIAESPGGFIQAVNWKRRLLGLIDYMEGWTLEKEHAWRKLEDTSRSWSTKPELNIGNLFHKRVRDEIIRSHVNSKAFLISGDGGFDFSDDYESQETLALPLILAQMVVGLECLETGGVFILKIFDCFTFPTIQILWIFWKVFTGFRIIKPQTSRACNSEKYIVARGFNGIGKNLRLFLNKASQVLMRLENDSGDKDIRLDDFAECDVPCLWENMEPEFTTKFKDVLGEMIDNQTLWIRRGLNGFKIKKEDKVKMALNWCRTHHIPINHEYYQKHPSLTEGEGNGWQENHRQFSLRRRLSSVSPPLVD